MLFAMSENFRSALDHGQGADTYQPMIESVTEYARAHFGIEEQCMAACHCPAAQPNRDAHGRFMSVLREFQMRYDSRGFDLADSYALVTFIDQWLTHHIGRIDVQLLPCAGNPTPS